MNLFNAGEGTLIVEQTRDSLNSLGLIQASMLGSLVAPIKGFTFIAQQNVGHNVEC